MILTYNKFINKLNENLTSTKLNISDDLKKMLKDINDPFTNGLLKLELKNSVEFKDRYPDYLGINSDNFITYINSDIDTSDPYNDNRRSQLKFTKILQRIVKDGDKYLKDNNITQRDIELFANKIKKVDDKVKVYEWKGDDLLNAFNYDGRILKTFSRSCANFDQKKLTNGHWPEPTVEQFYFYTKNPDNISVVVAIEKGNVMARRLIFKGKQFFETKDFKKGDDVSVVSNYYGVGGYGSKYDTILIKWLKQNGHKLMFDNYNKSNIIIQMKNYKFQPYPPVDQMYINTDNGVISYPSYEHDISGTWKSAYKLYEPKFTEE